MFMLLANLVLLLHIPPGCSFKHFESSYVIVVKKESLLKILLASIILIF